MAACATTISAKATTHHLGARNPKLLLSKQGKSNVSTGLVGGVRLQAPRQHPTTRDVKSLRDLYRLSPGRELRPTGGVGNDVCRGFYAAGMPHLNQWSPSGDWKVGGEHAGLNGPKDVVDLCIGSMRTMCIWCSGCRPVGKLIRFRVTIDGAAPGENHGADVDGCRATVLVNEQRLYQLVRQTGAITDRTFEIRFLDAGVAGLRVYLRLKVSNVALHGPLREDMLCACA